MNRPLDTLSPIALRLSAALLLAVTWVIPAYNKLTAGGVQSFFTQRFGGTFLASFPGIAPSFYLIAITEAIAGLLAILSVVTGEFLGRKGAPLLKLATLLSILVFIKLGFGLRLVGDNDGAANLFQYTVGAFVLVLVLEWLEQRGAPTADAV